VAVEKVLGIVDHFQPLLFEVSDTLFDHTQVFIERGAQGVGHMEVPRLAENRGYPGPRTQQGFEVFVVFYRDVRPPRAAKSRNLGVDELDVLDPLEKLDVLGIGTRPASLEIVDPKAVEAHGHVDLVLSGERDALSLGAVAQRRIVLPDLFSLFVPPAQSFTSFPLLLRRSRQRERPARSTTLSWLLLRDSLALVL